jgi:hypothetical protein
MNVDLTEAQLRRIRVLLTAENLSPEPDDDILLRTIDRVLPNFAAADSKQIAEKYKTPL